MVKRPPELFGKTPKIKTGCGNLYVTINENGGKPSEVLLRLGKAGGCAAAMTEGLGRMISLALRSGATDDDIIKQLSGIGCNIPAPACSSCVDGVAKILSMKDIPPRKDW